MSVFRIMTCGVKVKDLIDFACYLVTTSPCYELVCMHF